ncbi:MAG: hypothetical protein H0U70_12940 [Tatlockia sp.]|nr:hypothetical protein [Tatlockia sp.]
MGDLLNLIALIILIGIVMWIINALIPMAGAIKSLLNLFVLIILIIYILQFFHLINPLLPMIRVFH